MKKLIAAILLAIYLFNLTGQLVLHQYFTYLSDKFFNEQIAKGHYNVNDLTEVKIPVNMPAITDWKTYENVSGQIQFENVSYNYIKMKLTRDAMYLMCIPNYTTTHLSGDNIISAKQVKDYPVQKKQHVPYGKTKLWNKFSFSFLQFDFALLSKTNIATITASVQRIYYQSADVPEQPPRFVCKNSRYII